VRALFARASQAEKGATSVEYGLMVLLIALVIITAVSTLGTNLSSFFADTATSV